MGTSKSGRRLGFLFWPCPKEHLTNLTSTWWTSGPWATLRHLPTDFLSQPRQNLLQSLKRKSAAWTWPLLTGPAADFTMLATGDDFIGWIKVIHSNRSPILIFIKSKFTLLCTILNEIRKVRICLIHPVYVRRWWNTVYVPSE